MFENRLTAFHGHFFANQSQYNSSDEKILPEVWSDHVSPYLDIASLARLTQTNKQIRRQLFASSHKDLTKLCHFLTALQATLNQHDHLGESAPDLHQFRERLLSLQREVSAESDVSEDQESENDIKPALLTEQQFQQAVLDCIFKPLYDAHIIQNNTELLAQTEQNLRPVPELALAFHGYRVQRENNKALMDSEQLKSDRFEFGAISLAVLSVAVSNLYGFVFLATAAFYGYLRATTDDEHCSNQSENNHTNHDRECHDRLSFTSMIEIESIAGLSSGLLCLTFAGLCLAMKERHKSRLQDLQNPALPSESQALLSELAQNCGVPESTQKPGEPNSDVPEEDIDEQTPLVRYGGGYNTLS